MTDCVFCNIVNGEREGHFVYNDDLHVAFLDKYPIDTGHCLVIPKEHHVLLTDMKVDNVAKIFSLVPKIATAILKATGADAFSIGQNNGKAAKQIVPHVHVHIIPRYNKKGTIWTKRQISTSEELASLAKKIHDSLL